MSLFSKSFYIAVAALVFAGSALIMNSGSTAAERLDVTKSCGPGVEGPFTIGVTFTVIADDDSDADVVTLTQVIAGVLQAQYGTQTVACGGGFSIDLTQTINGTEIRDLLEDAYVEFVELRANVFEVAQTGINVEYQGACNYDLAFIDRAPVSCTVRNTTAPASGPGVNVDVDTNVNTDVDNSLTNELGNLNENLIGLLNELINNNRLDNVNDNLNQNINTQNQEQINNQNVNIELGDVIVRGFGPSRDHNRPSGGRIAPPAAGDGGLNQFGGAGSYIAPLALAVLAAGTLRGATLVANKVRN